MLCAAPPPVSRFTAVAAWFVAVVELFVAVVEPVWVVAFAPEAFVPASALSKGADVSSVAPTGIVWAWAAWVCPWLSCKWLCDC